VLEIYSNGKADYLLWRDTGRLCVVVHCCLGIKRCACYVVLRWKEVRLMTRHSGPRSCKIVCYEILEIYVTVHLAESQLLVIGGPIR
jgi:hypothetical protein